MNSYVEIDAIDRRILEIIQVDATMSIHDIGEQVGLSVNPCWRRLKRMENEGIIERRVAILNPTKVGLGVTVFVSIRTDKHTPEWLNSFAEGIRKLPEIIECHRMSGDIDYLLKIVVSDISQYDQIYRRLITAVPGLSDVSSTFSMERLKYGTALPV